MIPDATPENLAPDLDWLMPRAIDPATGKLILPVQSYVVRTAHHTILIDGCVGEGKENPWHPPWHRRTDSHFLADLAALGIAPEAVDFVMCTHLHSDHVGWNTRLVDGRWVPTFANAKYVMTRTELTHWQATHGDGAGASFAESVLPVVESGQAMAVDVDYALDDEVWLEPSPGHTPGHTSIRLASGGDHAVMCGDLMHSPVQCAHPDWRASSDHDEALGRRTRHEFLDRYCESDVLILTAHFPSPSVGHIRRHGDAYRFRYDDTSSWAD